ncbi:MAG TPA: hypothetical protein VLR93_06875, partial [Patescibacteria group bacterium]|nr:hypothetical protein [Patescibacteria group bacterium]
MGDRRRVRRSVGSMVAGLLVATGLLAPAVVSVATADPAPDPLAGPFVDVALVPALGAESGSVAAPRLLAVRAGGTGVPGEVAVVLLVADGEDWTVHGEARVATGLPTPGPARLVGLDGS